MKYLKTFGVGLVSSSCAPPDILPRVLRDPFMPKSRLLAFVIKELREVVPPTVFSSFSETTMPLIGIVIGRVVGL
jgi:hypothetical protein